MFYFMTQRDDWVFCGRVKEAGRLLGVNKEQSIN